MAGSEIGPSDFENTDGLLSEASKSLKVAADTEYFFVNAMMSGETDPAIKRANLQDYIQGRCVKNAQELEEAGVFVTYPTHKDAFYQSLLAGKALSEEILSILSEQIETIWANNPNELPSFLLNIVGTAHGMFDQSQ